MNDIVAIISFPSTWQIISSRIYSIKESPYCGVNCIAKHNDLHTMMRKICLDFKKCEYLENII
jgi:ABC-type dipeptide/oligopeptide/nickel transport system permease subunit